MASRPVFTVSFRVDVPRVVQEHPDWATYSRFIENLRHRLQAEPPRYSHNRPVLPLQSIPPTQWFHIILQTTSHPNGITLRIRRDNLYLDGYQMENSEQWLEFDPDNGRQHLIPGSTFLDFGGGYPNLEGTERDKISLGQNQLTSAVNELATSTDFRVRKEWLIVVIQMISESIRFDSISNHIATTFSAVLPKEILALENGWEDLSDALLYDDADPVGGFRRLPQPNKMNIRTVAEAAAAVGILLGLPIPRAPPRVEALGLGQCTQGRPLVEVFSVVRINNTGGKLYGIIKVTDGVRCQCIYNQKRDEGDGGSAALLSGPAGCISAYGSFTIDIALMDDIKGQISLNVYDVTNVYDQLLQENVKGEKGSVQVNYAVFRDAVGAKVEVILLNGDGNDPAYVYGQVTARNSNFTNQSTLFQKTLDENKRVSPGEPISLSRSVVAVPLNSSLVVGANLFVHNGYKRESEKEIAKGTAEFPAQCSGTFEKDIQGKYGIIRVKVTWTLDI